MVGELLEASAFGIFIAISLRPGSVTIIIPCVAKAFLSGEGRTPRLLCQKMLFPQLIIRHSTIL